MATDDELTCRELVELLTDYLEGAMSLAERHRFESHLDSCRVCPHYLEQLRSTVRVLGKLSEHEVPEPARTALLDVFRMWKTA